MAPISPRARRAQELVTALAAADASGVDALVAAAGTSLGAPAAHLSLLTDQQVSVGACGPLPIPRGLETPFDDSICANALRSSDALVIPDATADARVSSVPVVQAGLVRAYLGAPVHSAGHLVGVLCVTDAQEREWTQDDLAALRETVTAIEAEFDRIV